MGDTNSHEQRGFQDATSGRRPLFRSTKAYGIVANGDDHLSDGWSESDRRAYLDGYASGENLVWTRGY